MKSLFQKFSLGNAIAGLISLGLVIYLALTADVIGAQQSIALALWLGGAVVAFSFGLTIQSHGINAILIALVIGLAANVIYWMPQ